jgi:transcriptional regulator with GAF, ATPase, and Fis domain
MRENLIRAQEDEKKRQYEDNLRKWSNEGLAQFNELLRQGAGDIDKLTANIVRHLVNFLDANQSGLFLLNDNNKEDVFLELVATYAYNRERKKQKKIYLGEGLVGMCAVEKSTIYLNDIPEGYLSISSGLGGSAPKSLLIVPLKLEDEIFGVIEIASFNKFKKHEIEFVERVTESISSTISLAKINTRTALLLEKSQRQAEEMAAQEEEMRQNLEEMQATQEEMAKSKKEAEIAINTLNSIANPVISIDKDFNVTYINDAGVNVSGVSRVNALNKKCYDLWQNPHCNTNECRCAIAMKTKKSETGKTFVEDLNMKIIYTGTPLFDEDGNVTGVIEEIIDLDKLK